jgi:hypothetical protein
MSEAAVPQSVAIPAGPERGAGGPRVRGLASGLPAAGFRTAAVDLRGYGGSDKPPRGYDLVTAGRPAGDQSVVPERHLAEQQQGDQHHRVRLEQVSRHADAVAHVVRDGRGAARAVPAGDVYEAPQLARKCNATGSVASRIADGT